MKSKKAYAEGTLQPGLSTPATRQAAVDFYSINYPVNRLSDMKYAPGTSPMQVASRPAYAEGSKVLRLAKKSERQSERSKDLKEKAGQIREFGKKKEGDYLNAVSNRVGYGSSDLTATQKEDLVKGTQYEKPLVKLRTKTEKRASYKDARSTDLQGRSDVTAKRSVMNIASLAGVNQQAKPGDNAQNNSTPNVVNLPKSKRTATGSQLPQDNDQTKGTITLQTTPAGSGKTISNTQGLINLKNDGQDNLSYTQGGQSYTLPDNTVRGRNTQALKDEGVPRVLFPNIKLNKGKIQRLTLGPDGQPMPSDGTTTPVGSGTTAAPGSGTDPGAGNIGGGAAGAAAAAAGVGGVANAQNPPTGPADYMQLFELAVKQGVDPKLAMTMASVAAQESGPNLSSELATKHGNYWGLQASSHPWANRVKMNDNLMGNEREFEAYANPEEGVKRWSDWITNLNPRYQKAGIGYVQDPYAAALVLRRAGYAEDPNWLAGVGKYTDQLMQKYGEQYGIEPPTLAELSGFVGSVPYNNTPPYWDRPLTGSSDPEWGIYSGKTAGDIVGGYGGAKGILDLRKKINPQGYADFDYEQHYKNFIAPQTPYGAGYRDGSIGMPTIKRKNKTKTKC